MSEDKQFDDVLDDIEEIDSLDEFTEILGIDRAISYCARRRIEELKEEWLLRRLLDSDYPEML